MGTAHMIDDTSSSPCPKCRAAASAFQIPTQWRLLYLCGKKFFFSLVQKRLDLLKHVLIYYFRVRVEGKVFLFLPSIYFIVSGKRRGSK